MVVPLQEVDATGTEPGRRTNIIQTRYAEVGADSRVYLKQRNSRCHLNSV